MHEKNEIVFSVIMPAYNREKVITAAVNSVLTQTFKNFELIIVDDASTDNTVELLRKIEDDRLKIIPLKQNGGAAKARNIAIQQSAGKFICFLDSDDSFEPEYLAEAYKALEASSNDVGFVWCGTRYHELKSDGSVKISERVWNPSVQVGAYRTFLKALHIGIGCGVSFRREVFESAGCFDESLPAAEDTDFFLRVAKLYGFAVIDKVLVNIYKTGSDRMSTRFNKLSKAYESFLPSHFDAINEDKSLRLKYYYKLCWLSYYDNNKGRARQYFKKVLKDSPFHTKAWTVGFLFEVLGEKRGARIHQKISKMV